MFCMCICNSQQDRRAGVGIPPPQVVMSITKKTVIINAGDDAGKQSDSLLVRV